MQAWYALSVVNPIHRLLHAWKWWLPPNAAAHGPGTRRPPPPQSLDRARPSRTRARPRHHRPRQAPQPHSTPRRQAPASEVHSPSPRSPSSPRSSRARAEALLGRPPATPAPIAAPRCRIEVTGLQFAWYFRYPEPRPPPSGSQQSRNSSLPEKGANPLGLDPTDPHSADDFCQQPVLVTPCQPRSRSPAARAQDVLHGFSVPEMRLKQNAVPGQDIHIHFTPTAPGDYAIPPALNSADSATTA